MLRAKRKVRKVLDAPVQTALVSTASCQVSSATSVLGSSVPPVSVVLDVSGAKSAASASGSSDVSVVSNVPEASARVSGTVSGVPVVCPVSALTGGQSALA